MKTIDELLIQSVLDSEFLAQLRRDPESILDEYNLTEEQRDIICNPDNRLVKLMGECFLRQHSDHDDAVSPDDHKTQECSIRDVPSSSHDSEHDCKLPDVELLLRLVPYAVETPVNNQRQLSVTYSVHIDWLTPGLRPEDIPVPHIEQTGDRLNPVSLIIRVAPIARSTAESLILGYTARMEELSMTAPSSGSIETVWNHQLDSDETRAAATAVLQASQGERRAKLVDLVQVVTGGEVQ